MKLYEKLADEFIIREYQSKSQIEMQKSCFRAGFLKAREMCREFIDNYPHKECMIDSCDAYNDMLRIGEKEV